MNRIWTEKSVAAASILLLVFMAAGCQRNHSMDITQADWGRVDGRPVSLYTLKNHSGMTAKITNYGGIVTELHAPDAKGKTADIVLGFDTVEEYIASSPYFGAMVGRVGNRIALGKFTLNGVDYQLATNNDPNHLHGGVKGFDKVIWQATPTESKGGPTLRLAYRSPDGEEGYPGTLDAIVDYTLTNNNELRVEMWATTDKPTPVNIVHHSYWNLAGHKSGTILGHNLHLNADRYTPADATLIPTGAIDPVEGTPFDFRSAKPIGRDIAQLPPSGDDPGGYDLNFVLNDPDKDLRLAAIASDPDSGRVMKIYTNEPGIQFYSGNFMDGFPGKDGATYDKHDGFCLETQHFPDAVNKGGTPGWDSVILHPGETYHHLMVHEFSTTDR